MKNAQVTPPATDAERISDFAPSERISLLNHDIRAAMSDVIGGLRLVDPDTLTGQTRTQLDRVRSSGEVLARLLEEALSYIDDSSPLAATHRNLNLERFLHDLDMRWTGRAKAHGVQFSLKALPNVPQVICTDRMALDRILGNLLSNALKYAGPKGVEMRVGLNAAQEVQVCIRDDGPGFSDAALSRLFEFAARPRDAAQPGSGLGLRIAKELSDHLDGNLSVVNLPEGGAKVTLRLPRAAWELASPGAVAEDLPDLTGLKVLVADDNETNQLLTGKMLEIMGAEYEIAPDGIEALNWLEREDFDIALIDMEMPKLNGIEVMRAFRARPGPPSPMPLIALTAYVLKTNRDAIFNAGADGIIAKPILDIASFGQAIATHLAAVPPQGDAPVEITLPDLAQADRVDCRRMDELMEIAGPGSALDLLDRLVSDLGRVHSHLAAAASETDRAVIRAESHVLISLSGAIGADGLYQLALALNGAAHRNDAAAIQTLTSHTVEALAGVLTRVRKKRGGLAPS